jgi:hypothetical protein
MDNSKIGTAPMPAYLITARSTQVNAHSLDKQQEPCNANVSSIDNSKICGKLTPAHLITARNVGRVSMGSDALADAVMDGGGGATHPFG